MRQKFQRFILSIAITVVSSFYSNAVQAQSAQQNIQNPTDLSNLIPPTNPTFPYGDINQQGGIINNGINGQSNCGRACLGFYTDFSRNDTRFGINLSIPLSAPENEVTSAQAKRTLYDVEAGYIKGIAEACQSKDYLRAELNAKGLARVWSITDPKALLSNSCSQ